MPECMPRRHREGTPRRRFRCQYDLKVYELPLGRREAHQQPTTNCAGRQKSRAVRRAVPRHEPAKNRKRDQLYLHSIPYMQFPLFVGRASLHGPAGLDPGREVSAAEKDFWTRHCREIWQYYQTHPEGPFSYGWWDSCPGRPDARPTHRPLLKQYRPLVEEGNLGVARSERLAFIAAPCRADVVVGLRQPELVPGVGQLRSRPASVQTSAQYAALVPQSGPRGDALDLPADRS